MLNKFNVRSLKLKFNLRRDGSLSLRLIIVFDLDLLFVATKVRL